MSIQELRIFLLCPERKKFEEILEKTSLEEIINLLIVHKRYYLIYTFLKNFPYAPQSEKLFEILLTCQEPTYLLEASFLPNAPLEAIGQSILFTKEQEAILTFIENHPTFPFLQEMKEGCIKIQKVSFIRQELENALHIPVAFPKIDFYLDFHMPEFHKPIEKFIKKWIRETIEAYSYQAMIDQMSYKEQLYLFKKNLQNHNFLFLDCYSRSLITNPSSPIPKGLKTVSDQKYRSILRKNLKETRKKLTL